MQNKGGCAQKAQVRSTVRPALTMASSTSVTSCRRFGSAARVCAWQHKSHIGLLLGTADT